MRPSRAEAVPAGRISQTASAAKMAREISRSLPLAGFLCLPLIAPPLLTPNDNRRSQRPTASSWVAVNHDHNVERLWFGAHPVPEPAVVCGGNLINGHQLAVTAGCQRHDLTGPCERTWSQRQAPGPAAPAG